MEELRARLEAAESRAEHLQARLSSITGQQREELARLTAYEQRALCAQALADAGAHHADVMVVLATQLVTERRS